MTRIMLVDDHAIFRVGLRVVIDAEEDCQVVAEASSGEEALAKLDEARPDIVLLDIGLSGRIDGLEAARQRVAHLADQARAHLDPFGRDAEILKASVDFVLKRRS